MKYELRYHEFSYGNDYGSFPEYTHSEIVETDNTEDLEIYILAIRTKKGHIKFKKEKRYTFDYVSGTGGIKIVEYKEPEIKNIQLLTEFDLDYVDNLEFGDIDFSDYPKFVDAYIESADFNGVPLTETQLDDLNDNHYDWAHEKIHEHIF